MITSNNNAKVKQVVQWQTKAKERRKDHVFLAEGIRMCEEAPVQNVREVYLTEELEQKIRQNAQNGDTAFWDKLQQTGYETASPEVFAKMADTQTPQGILTVLEQPVYDLTQLLEQPDPLFLMLENLQDPGNLGTMIRTGEGAGIIPRPSVPPWGLFSGYPLSTCRIWHRCWNRCMQKVSTPMRHT